MSASSWPAEQALEANPGLGIVDLCPQRCDLAFERDQPLMLRRVAECELDEVPTAKAGEAEKESSVAHPGPRGVAGSGEL